MGGVLVGGHVHYITLCLVHVSHASTCMSLGLPSRHLYLYVTSISSMQATVTFAKSTCVWCPISIMCVY